MVLAPPAPTERPKQDHQSQHGGVSSERERERERERGVWTCQLSENIEKEANVEKAKSNIER